MMYDYNKSRSLFTYTDNDYVNFSKNKEMFDFSNNYADSKYYDDSNWLFVGKIEDEMSNAAVQEIVSLK